MTWTAERKMAVYHQRRAAGLCGNCGAVPERGAYCNDCRAVHNGTYARARARGECVICGDASPEFSKCRPCRLRHSRRRKPRGKQQQSEAA